MYKKTAIFALATLILSIHIKGETTLSLTDVIKRSLSGNYRIKLIKNSEKSVNRGNTWGEAGRYPSISISGTYAGSRLKSGSAPSVPTREFTSSLDLNWTIFDGFKIGLRKKTFGLQDKQAAIETTSIIENTLKEVTVKYYNLLLEKEKLNVNRKLAGLADDSLKRELEKKKFGNSSEFQVLEAKKSMLSFRNQLLKQQISVNTARRNLLFLMGESPAEKYTFSGNFKALPRVFNTAGLIEKTTKHNSDLKSHRISNRILETKQALSSSEWLPAVTLSGGLRDTRPINSPHTSVKSFNSYINLGMNFTLFNGGRRKVASAKAQLAVKAGRLKLEELLLSVKNHIKTYIENYNISKEGLRLAEEELKAAELSLTLSKEKFRSGSINSFEYRDVQLKYLQASNRKLEAIFSMISSEIEIMHISGSLTTSARISIEADKRTESTDILK